MSQVQDTPNGNPIMTTSLYVGDLHKNVNDSQLYDLFNQIVQVVSVRICRDLATSQSLGYGYVNFSNPQDAAKALDELNFTPLNNKPIRIMYSIRDPSARKSNTANIFVKEDRGSVFSSSNSKFTNLYVKNLPESLTEAELRNVFGQYGTITSAIVMRNVDGSSRCFGFVNFENPDNAAKAVEALNGKKFDDKEWYVGKAMKKSERELELKGSLERSMNESSDKYEDANL
ncbi:unnamed protein product [Lupinus luteus]|uniref:RRM domain-containing protein n=1 Tax=Lupinus luteus TaxID=3873 RepID=A0AAV1XDI2_LUPLU